MEGFSWMIIIPAGVLCTTILWFAVENKRKTRVNTESPLLRHAISTDDTDLEALIKCTITRNHYRKKELLK